MTRHRWQAPFAGAAAVALSAAALTTALAAPATAAVPNFPGYGPVDHQTSASVSSPKTDTASCGAEYVLGAGMLAGGGVDVRYDDLIPSDHEVNSKVYEDDSGNVPDWGITTRALCSEEPGVGYQIVSATSTPRDSDPSNQATASCPGGKDLIGTGWAISGGFGHVGVTEVRPTPADTVVVTAFEDDTGWGADWDVTAYAICVAGISGQRIQSHYTGFHSGTHGATNACSTDEVALGGGFQVQGRQEFTTLTTFWPGNVYLGEGLLTVTVKEDDAGTPDNWGMTHYQICADA
jgi:hypothetical protein